MEKGSPSFVGEMRPGVIKVQTKLVGRYHKPPFTVDQADGTS